MTFIIERLEEIKDWFLDAYYEVNSWIVPFKWLAPPLYGLYVATHYLWQRFISFDAWLVWLSDTIAQFLTSWEIRDLLKDTIDFAVGAWAWVINATGNIQSVINNWWSPWQSWITAIVDNARDWLKGLIDNLEAAFLSVKTAWDYFWTVLYPTLIGRGEAESLIQSALIEWFPWYDTLSLFIGDIGEFFGDPLEWIYTRLESFIERYW